MNFHPSPNRNHIHKVNIQTDLRAFFCMSQLRLFPSAPGSWTPRIPGTRQSRWPPDWRPRGCTTSWRSQRRCPWRCSRARSWPGPWWRGSGRTGVDRRIPVSPPSLSLGRPDSHSCREECCPEHCFPKSMRRLPSTRRESPSRLVALESWPYIQLSLQICHEKQLKVSLRSNLPLNVSRDHLKCSSKDYGTDIHTIRSKHAISESVSCKELTGETGGDFNPQARNAGSLFLSLWRHGGVSSTARRQVLQDGQ